MSRGNGRPVAARARRIALVLWNGAAGGAEVFTLQLSVALRKTGNDARIVFVGDSAPLADRVAEARVPFETLGLRRGAAVLLKPRRLARVVGAAGADGAVLVSGGYLASMLRIGGFRAPIISVEHGVLLLQDELPLHRRIIRFVDRQSGVWANDAQVAVSEYMLRHVRAHRHPARLVRIYNGVDVGVFRPKGGDGERRTDGGMIVGCAARLIDGKGVDVLVRALRRMRCSRTVLHVAGDGPARRQLRRLAVDLGLENRVEFLGYVSDMPTFWNACDIAAVPSSGCREAFGMVAAEAMACGRPVVAVNVGGLPEIVTPGRTGALVPPGDAEALAAALDEYARDPTLRSRHGAEARDACVAAFSIDRCARQYVDLLQSL